MLMQTLSGDLKASSPQGAKRVLVLGGGFGGIYAALELDKLKRRHVDLEVTLITRDNYFLFTPMLPEVAAGELEQSTIINPLRRLLKRVKTFVGAIEAIDLKAGCRIARVRRPHSRVTISSARHSVRGGYKLLQPSWSRGFVFYHQNVK